ncbi:hypothetical protein FQZ97_905670 [compost metagenome]
MAINTLGHFLQVRLWVAPATCLENGFELTCDVLMNKLGRIIIPTLEINCTNNRLESVGKNLLTCTSAAVLFTTTHTHQWFIPKLVARFTNTLCSH